MTYSILIRKNPKGGYTARALGWPEFVARAATRAEALKRIRQTLTKTIAAGEIIEIEVPVLSVIPASYSETFGMFKDDPTFAQFTRATKTYRRVRNRVQRRNSRP